MKDKSKKLIGAQILGIVSVVWIALAALFHIFWEPPRPSWVAQFIFIGIALVIVWIIIVGIALLITKLGRRHIAKNDEG